MGQASSGRRIPVLAAISLAASVMPVSAAFKFSYKDCKDVTDADFKATVLFSHATNPATEQPLKMAFDMDASGNTDIYFVQRAGALRRYNGAAKTLSELGTLPVTTESSDGLNGIALDPGFKTNKWIYLFYTVSDIKVWRISRFTLKADKLDLASEKIILVIPTKGSSQHPGGGMGFDAQGNLWIGSGENNMVTGGGAPAGSTYDLRGKILRIRPKPIADATVLAESGVGITYDIPEGNLFPVGMAKTLPEIFVMGVRNPYSLTLDAGRKAVTWGDVGPDGNPKPTEEHNLTSKPMNGGWPFFAGDNVPLGDGGTVDKPTNTTKDNKGLVDLPPLTPGLHSYPQDCAITGPVYYYDRIPAVKGRLPPHFNGKWFVTDYQKSWVRILSLDDKGEKILKEDTAFAGILNKNIFKNPLDFQGGPDGALYLVNYAGNRTTPVNDITGIIKIEYTGDCLPPPIVDRVGGRGETGALGIDVIGTRISIADAGAHTVVVSDFSGRVLERHMGKGPKQYDLGNLKAGRYLVRITTGQGVLTTTLRKD